MTTASHDTELLKKAVQVAVFYQNLCCDLEEIIELFCMDAAQADNTIEELRSALRCCADIGESNVVWVANEALKEQK